MIKILAEIMKNSGGNSGGNENDRDDERQKELRQWQDLSNMITHNIQEKSQGDNTRLEQNLKALKAKVDSITTL